MKVLSKIHNEKCQDTMSNLPDGFVDLVVTSPPYDDLREYSGCGFDDFEGVAQGLLRVVKDGGVVVWIVADQTKNGSETGTSFKQALYFKEIGFNLFDTMIYQKPPRGAVGNNRTYWQSFEYMFILSKGKPKSINLICDRENKDSRAGDNSTKRLADGSRKKVSRSGYGKFGRRTNVWQYLIGKNHSTKDEIAFTHPAIFPEKLAADHILSWSNEGDIVYDPFNGSGTTTKMAKYLNRQWFGSEVDPNYCEIANHRIGGLV